MCLFGHYDLWLIIINSYASNTFTTFRSRDHGHVGKGLLKDEWLEAKVLGYKYGQDSGKVFHCGSVHLLLSVVQCVPKQRKRCGDQMQHRNTWRQTGTDSDTHRNLYIFYHFFKDNPKLLKAQCI